MKLPCPFCVGKMRALSPSGGNPTFRCRVCTVRVVVSNQAYMPEAVRKEYWRIVNEKRLMDQE